MPYQINERDKVLLNFINDFGYVGLTHIMQLFKLKQSNCYRITKQLMNKNLIELKKIYQGQKGVYVVTKEGSSWTELPPLKEIQKAKCDHQFKVIDVYIALVNKYPNVEWITERYLYQSFCYKRKLRYQHIPDALLKLPDKEKPIAIEIELSAKSIKRLKKIFLYYTGAYTIAETWYFASHKILTKLKALAKDNQYIKFFDIDEVING